MYVRMGSALACLAIVVLFATVRLHAGPPLTLRAAIAEAFQHNPDIKVAYHDALIAGADVTSAGLRANPSLNLVGDILPAPGEPFIPGSKYYGASLSIPLDLFGHRSRRSTAARESAAAAEAQYQDNLRQVRLKVTTAFYTALALRDRLELATQNLTRLDDFVRINKLRQERQQIPTVDVTRAEFTRSQFEAEVRTMSTDYRSSLINLQTLLGREVVSDSLLLESDIEEITPPDSIGLQEATDYALQHRADYRSLQKQLNADKANNDLQHSLALPDLGLSLDYSRQQYVDFYGATINLGLPIFNRNQGEIEKSGYRVAQDEYALAGVKAKLSAEIRTAYDEMTSRWQTVQQQKRDILPQAEQILKTVGYAYSIGSTTLLDYLEAQRSFTESRIAYIQTLLDYHISQTLFATAISKEESL